MLFGNADIEGAVGERLAEDIDAGTARHRRRDGDDLVVLARFLDQALAEHRRIGRRVGFCLGLRSGGDVELGDGVILVVGRFGGRVALALLRDNMNQDRSGRRIAHVGQHRQQVVEVVAVDRPDIEEAEFFEQRAAGDHAARIFLGAQRAVLEEFRKFVREIFQRFARRRIGLSGQQPREIGRHRADRRSDRHVVVVENYDQARVHRAGIVHRFIGHAGGHRAVADHRDDIVLAAGKIARHRHAEACGNRGRGVRRAERIVFALGALREP